MLRLATALLLLSAPAAAQTTHTVQLTWNGQGAFTPSELTVALGDTVRWDWVSGFHNVESFDALFSSGAPTVGPHVYDVVFDQAFLNAAAAAGVGGTSFDYHCVPHLASGMVGNITVALPGAPLLEVGSLSAGGTATIKVSAATPGGIVGVAYSLTGQGPTSLPAGPCGLIAAALAAPVTVAALLPANASGTMSFNSNVPASAAGVEVYLHALDLTSCRLSNSGAWRIR